jgi:hypothetical protein
MTADARMAGRVRRLAVVSVVALGLIFALWSRTGRGEVLIGAALAAGWVLMPSMLVLSLRWPQIRYGLVVPSVLVGSSLLAICLFSPMPSTVTKVGWWQICAGVLMGGVLGGWFWFRWLPVPAQLNDPLSPGRWALITLHAGLIVVGLVLVGLQP